MKCCFKKENSKCEVCIIGKRREIIFSKVHGEQKYVNLYIVTFVVPWNLLYLDANTSSFSFMIVQG